MSGLENVEVAKVQGLSATITKEGGKLSANAYPALELVHFSPLVNWGFTLPMLLLNSYNQLYLCKTLFSLITRFKDRSIKRQ